LRDSLLNNIDDFITYTFECLKMIDWHLRFMGEISRKMVSLKKNKIK
jgi:hypothetical protein